MRRIIRLLPAMSLLLSFLVYAQEKQDPTAPKTARELGLEIGVMATGKWNAITDVTGVKVGHHTLVQGDSVRTGVII